MDTAQGHVRDLLAMAIEHDDSKHDAVVVFDTQCDLSIALTKAYRECLSRATFIDFNAVTPEEIRAAFQALKPSDLVVLIQSTNFRLNEFRIRVELFARSLKVIEHPHLQRMTGSLQPLYYLDSLAYDPGYYRVVGRALKTRIDGAKTGVVDSGGEQLVFEGGFESAKLNVGDYSGMKNVGGQFPIGEVFTEARDLESVNGRIRILAFGDTTFRVNKPGKPITAVVTKGRVTDVIDSTPDFDKVLANIRADEGEVWIRELGFGLNRAFTRERMVSDIGTYERMCGVHLSLGAKHNIYKKPGFKFTQKTAMHHVDIFAVTEAVTLDGENVYRDGAWRV